MIGYDPGVQLNGSLSIVQIVLSFAFLQLAASYVLYVSALSSRAVLEWLDVLEGRSERLSFSQEPVRATPRQSGLFRPRVRS